MKNAFHKNALDRAVKAYTAAIKESTSVKELAGKLGIQTGAARNWIRRRIDLLPADAKPQWVLDAVRVKTPQESGAAGGKKNRKKPSKMAARSPVKRGAAAQLSAIKAQEAMGHYTPAKITLSDGFEAVMAKKHGKKPTSPRDLILQALIQTRAQMAGAAQRDVIDAVHCKLAWRGADRKLIERIALDSGANLAQCGGIETGAKP